MPSSQYRVRRDMVGGSSCAAGGRDSPAADGRVDYTAAGKSTRDEEQTRRQGDKETRRQRKSQLPKCPRGKDLPSPSVPLLVSVEGHAAQERQRPAGRFDG